MLEIFPIILYNIFSSTGYSYPSFFMLILSNELSYLEGFKFNSFWLRSSYKDKSIISIFAGIFNNI